MPRQTPSSSHLSRRERQIMDIIYTRSQATVAEVHQAMGGQPSYSAVRALMGILETKGHLRHRAEGNRYVYLPTRSRHKASKSAARRLVETFFGGSTEKAVAALLEVSESHLDDQEIERLVKLIENARKEGR